MNRSQTKGFQGYLLFGRGYLWENYSLEKQQRIPEGPRPAWRREDSASDSSTSESSQAELRVLDWLISSSCENMRLLLKTGCPLSSNYGKVMAASIFTGKTWWTNGAHRKKRAGVEISILTSATFATFRGFLNWGIPKSLWVSKQKLSSMAWMTWGCHFRKPPWPVGKAQGSSFAAFFCIILAGDLLFQPSQTCGCQTCGCRRFCQGSLGRPSFQCHAWMGFSCAPWSIESIVP